jgi:hypothetical protein
VLRAWRRQDTGGTDAAQIESATPPRGGLHVLRVDLRWGIRDNREGREISQNGGCGRASKRRANGVACSGVSINFAMRNCHAPGIQSSKLKIARFRFIPVRRSSHRADY